MKLKYNEINVGNNEVFNGNSYPKEGFYKVNVESWAESQLILKKDGLVWTFGDFNMIYNAINENIEVSEKPKDLAEQNGVSEKLFLKTLSLVINKESYKE